jgi:hypothetical protein
VAQATAPGEARRGSCRDLEPAQVVVAAALSVVVDELELEVSLEDDVEDVEEESADVALDELEDPALEPPRLSVL